MARATRPIPLSFHEDFVRRSSIDEVRQSKQSLNTYRFNQFHLALDLRSTWQGTKC
jgi:hypothetical protein